MASNFPQVLVIVSSVIFGLPQIFFFKRVKQVFQLKSTIMLEACWCGAKMGRRDGTVQSYD